MPLQEPGHGLALRPRLLRPKLHDPAALPRPEARAAKPGRKRGRRVVERGENPGAGGRGIIGGAEVEGDRGSLGLHVEPGSIAEHPPHLVTQPPRDRAVPGEARVVGHPEPLGRGAHGKIPALDPVVAKVGQPADTDAGGDVQGRAAGKDRERQSFGPSVRRAGQPSEGVAGGREDGRRRRVGGDRRQRPVEVAHHEEPAGHPGQRADGDDGPLDDGRRRVAAGLPGTAATGGLHATARPSRRAGSTRGPAPSGRDRSRRLRRRARPPGRR